MLDRFHQDKSPLAPLALEVHLLPLCTSRCIPYAFTMCGIGAIHQLGEAARSSWSRATLQRMMDLVEHRGPDGSGFTALSREDMKGGHGFTLQHQAPEDAMVALGHRRLSIIEASNAGRQPMLRGEGLAVTFNGEIYNYIELRDALSEIGQDFKTQSDTEVLLAAYETWGSSFVSKLNGMWSFVIVDRRRQCVVVSRDRLGIKPLYRVEHEGRRVFTSEIKQLCALPRFKLRAYPEATQAYLRSGYHGTESATFFENVSEFPAGVLREYDLQSGRLQKETNFWNPSLDVQIHEPDEAAHVFLENFERSVSLRLRSDVPVGAALSGGLDSSSVVAMMRKVSKGESDLLKTFSVVFPGESIDETPFVESVLERYPGPNFRSVPRFTTFQNELDRWAWAHDEPVGSVAQFAGYLLAQATRKNDCKVSLNGQGGDEIFAGYWQSYFANLLSWGRGGALLRVVQNLGASLLPSGNNHLARQIPFIARRYLARRGANTGIESILGMSPQERRLYEIRRLHLPRLLKWDDRNLMAHSVEGRYPFLDHHLIEAVLSISTECLYNSGWVKEPLRRSMSHLLPVKILKRKSKLGFETPHGKWFRRHGDWVRERLVGPQSRVASLIESSAEFETLVLKVGQRRLLLEEEHHVFRLLMLDAWARAFELSLSP